jgi:hypothetical protein
VSAVTGSGVPGPDTRPAWLVLDAARSHRFTGEVVFRTQPVVRVSFDRGEIYFAERTSDSSLPQRLVEAGVLTPAQLERGSVKIGGVRHLGRLFDRLPGLDPHALLLAVDLLTEECVSWLAARQVAEVAWIPYRRHASGVHQWRERDGRQVADLVDPMLSPLAALGTSSTVRPIEVPVDVAAAESFESVTADVRIEWVEPAWLDDVVVEGAAGRVDEAGSPDPGCADDDTDAALPGWSDDGLDPSALGTASMRRRRPSPDPIDRFEMVWPSGEVDDQLGSIDESSTVADAVVPTGAIESPTDGEPARPSTTIRRRALADDDGPGGPADVSTGVSGDVSTRQPATDRPDGDPAGPDPDGHRPGDVGIDAHPATRRRMLPRRR